MSLLRVGGVARFSTCDYPSNITTTLFLQGCMFRCAYCHNHDLISSSSSNLIPFEKVFNFIEHRKDLLDGVVFSGGEPLLQSGLLDAIKEVKSLNLKVGLHTSGVPYARFKEVLSYVDWIGFDVKTLFDDYKTITGVPKGNEVKDSLKLLLESNTDYEVRTTVHSKFHSNDSLNYLGNQLANMGVKIWTLQKFRKEGVKDASLHVPLLNLDLDENVTKRFENFSIRG